MPEEPIHLKRMQYTSYPFSIGVADGMGCVVD
jgi:hypothetical protein